MTTQIRPVLDIPIFHKIYDLYKLLHTYQLRIPKSDRYTLWAKCENTTLALLESLIETSHLKGEERIKVLYIMSNRLDLLKVMIRLAKDTRAIDNPQYLEIQTFIQEIGKMIGGWIKSVPPLSFLNGESYSISAGPPRRCSRCRSCCC
jgi:hypothetical protein